MNFEFAAEYIILLSYLNIYTSILPSFQYVYLFSFFSLFQKISFFLQFFDLNFLSDMFKTIKFKNLMYFDKFCVKLKSDK